MLCARSPVLIMPRVMFGVPNSRTLQIEKPCVSWRVRIWARAVLTRVFQQTRSGGCVAPLAGARRWSPSPLAIYFQATSDTLSVGPKPFQA